MSYWPIALQVHFFVVKPVFVYVSPADSRKIKLQVGNVLFVHFSYQSSASDELNIYGTRALKRIH